MFRNIIRVFGVAFVPAVCGMTALAQAGEPTTIFGIPLGQRFAVPECPHDITNLMETCWTYDENIIGPGLDRAGKQYRQLHFSTAPALGFRIDAIVHDDVMDGVLVFTHGVRSQDEAMTQLRKKFGKPTHFNVATVQNRMGAKFIPYHSVWDYPRYYVQFDADGSNGGSEEGRLDRGTIEILSHAYRVKMIKDWQRTLKARQPL